MTTFCNLFDQENPTDVFIFVFQTFNFDVETLDWNTYFVRFVLGIKQFLLKEDLANLPVAQSRIRRLV